VDDIALPIPDELIDALARRVAAIVVSEMGADLRPSQGRWLRAKDAAEYLGWTRSALYDRVHGQSIPHYKVDQMLLFKARRARPVAQTTPRRIPIGLRLWRAVSSASLAPIVANAGRRSVWWQTG
jgi:hypothetical protein